jgi:hypothetical protein
MRLPSHTAIVHDNIDVVVRSKRWCRQHSTKNRPWTKETAVIRER